VDWLNAHGKGDSWSTASSWPATVPAIDVVAGAGKTWMVATRATMTETKVDVSTSGINANVDRGAETGEPRFDLVA